MKITLKNCNVNNNLINPLLTVNLLSVHIFNFYLYQRPCRKESIEVRIRQKIGKEREN